jgi:hypothetical protein
MKRATKYPSPQQTYQEHPEERITVMLGPLHLCILCAVEKIRQRKSAMNRGVKYVD